MTTRDEYDEKVRGWFTGRLPDGWFEGEGSENNAVEVLIDREEITVVGRIPAPSVSVDVSPAERAAAIEGKVKGFREDTRDRRIAIAREAEHRFGPTPPGR